MKAVNVSSKPCVHETDSLAILASAMLRPVDLVAVFFCVCPSLKNFIQNSHARDS